MSKTTKIIISVVVIALLVWAGWRYVVKEKALVSQKNDILSPVPANNTALVPEKQVFSPLNTTQDGKNAVVVGVVLKNETEGVKRDLPAFLVIRTLDGQTARIVYSPGDSECQNQEAADDGFKIKAGEKNWVEAYGKVITDGSSKADSISTCESKDFYIESIPEQ